VFSNNTADSIWSNADTAVGYTGYNTQFNSTTQVGTKSYYAQTPIEFIWLWDIAGPGTFKGWEYSANLISSTSSPPAGFSSYYQMNFLNNTLPGWLDFPIQLVGGKTTTFTVWFYSSLAAASRTTAPIVQIIDNNQQWFSSASVLASTVFSGSASTWTSYTVSYTPSSSYVMGSVKNAILRITAQASSGTPSLYFAFQQRPLGLARGAY
jgi:hypothetical protein